MRRLRAVLATVLVAAVLGGWLDASGPGQPSSVMLGGTAVAAVAAVIGLWLLERGRLRPASWVASLGVLVAVLTSGLPFDQASEGSVYLVLVVPLVIAGAFNGRVALYVLGALVIAGAAGLYLAHLTGLAGWVPPSPTMDVLFIIIGGGVLVVVVDQAMSLLRDAHARTEDARRALEVELAARREAEQARRDSEATLELIATSSREVFSVLDHRRCYVYASPAYTRVLGLPPAELVGTPALERVHPEDLAAVADAFEEIARTGHARAQFRYRHADQRWRWFDARGATATWKGQPVVVVVGHDATEERALQQELDHARRLEAVGMLAGGIAHDFNNLLVPILTGASSARDGVPADSPLRADLDDVVAAAERAADLVRQLVTFARPAPVGTALVDLAKVLRDFRRVLALALPPGVDLQLALPDSPVTVRIDRGRFEQVVMNLVINARDAMPGLGVVRVSLLAPTDDGVAERRIQDTGTGMDAGTARRAFEPFFTTKAPGRGTGLGLSTVHGIVREVGGSVRLDTAPGQGTTAVVRIPTRGTPPEQEGSAPGGNETVLVVEDEPLGRRYTARALRHLGYRVLEASTVTEALTVAATERPELVLSDRALVEAEANRAGPAELPPVLLVSGSSSPAAHEHVLRRPFTTVELAARVRALLERERRGP